ncbi:hypothetical protein BH09MYX1_BH09MYX1_51150 [soil metagenome]
MSARVRFSLSLLGIALAGCGTEPEPKPILAATPPIDGTDTTIGARTVGFRNPLGHVQITDNLFADGDFELTGRSGQMPWVAFGNGGQATLNYSTGGLCYSGVRCASLAKGQAMVGYMASPPTGSVDVSIKVKTATKSCSEVSIMVVDQSDAGPNSSLFPGSPTPDGTGWCTYRGTMKNLARLQPVLYVTTQAANGILVDDGIAQAISTQSMSLAAGAPPSAALLAEAHDAMRFFREHRIFGLPRGPHVDDLPRNLLPSGTE